MENKIILILDKLKEVKGMNTGDFIEMEKTISVIANSITVYKDSSTLSMHKSIFEDENDLNSMITYINKEIKAVISSLDNLNIQSSILIEVDDICLDAYVDLHDLDDFCEEDINVVNKLSQKIKRMTM